uniref:ZBR-type domain-containing protein n=1 Tax=Monopterus albus TaxID=43700 RepID=A0A3Q3JTZ8_MONAL
MQCTPESNVFLERCKGQHYLEDSSDSGYSGVFHSPGSISGADPCKALSPEEFNEAPKENLRQSVTPKDRTRESVRLLDKDSRGVQQSSSVSWCETPKLYKRDHSLRQRLRMCKPSTDVEPEGAGSPYTRKTELFISAKSEHWLSASFDSLDTVIGALASSTLKLEQDLPLSGRKCRLLFSQVRTSTLDDNKLNSGHPPNFERGLSLLDADFSESISACDQINAGTPCSSKLLSASSKEASQSPVSGVTNGLLNSSSVLCTPSSTHTPKFIRYVRSACEDSGFSSLTLDKYQDSSVDHDGSFQELLLSASRKNSETPNLAEAKRRSRLHRQHRLSTLKEGSSQSDDDPLDRRHERLPQCHSHFEDVFADSITSRCVLSDKCGNGITSDVDLSLTPALQLVHAMCQQRAQMFAGQSPSLKEQLKSTAALAQTPVMFRTTMPLAGLIGRKMGLGKVDILTELKKRNLRHILAIILGHLTSESLGAAAHVPDAETRLALLKRSALKTVQSQSRTLLYCTPHSEDSTLTKLQHSGAHSGSKSKRDKTLFSDECLRPCPRCQHPARCRPVKGEGVCSRASCGFQFCTACLCAFHGSRECGSQSVGRRKKDIILPGSAQSKRNVKRL